MKIYEFSLNLRIHWLLKTSNEIQLAKQTVELGQCLYLHKFKMEPFYGNKITQYVSPRLCKRNICPKEDFGAIKETEQKETIYGYIVKSHESGLRTLKHDVLRVEKKNTSSTLLPSNYRPWLIYCQINAFIPEVFSSRRLKNLGFLKSNS